jgi:ABC-type dipeptide/oligopeptide/nickel transport system permease component
MIAYILKKLVSLLPTVLIAITITFLILRLTPGDPAQIMLGDYATHEAVQSLRARLGLDQPLYLQYWTYMKSFLQGDFGYSMKTGISVRAQILGVLPHTARLAIASMIVAVLFGVPFGVVSALYRNQWLDRIAQLITLIGISSPVFVIGFLLLLYFGFQLKLVPIIGAGDHSDPADLYVRLILPALTLGLSTGAAVARVTRSNMLEVLGEDYIRTARLKGLRERIVVGRHAIRNALIGVVSIISLQFSMLLGGAVITEAVFTRVGMGSILIESILVRDYPVIQGVIAVFLASVILINLFTDLFFGIIDPRLSH